MKQVYKVEEVVAYMEQVFPSSKYSSSSYESIAKKYIDISVNQLLKGFFSDDSASSDNIQFRISTLNENILNRYDRNKYWLPLLKENFPFFYTIQAGWKAEGVAVLSSVKPLYTSFECLGHFLSTDYGDILQLINPLDPLKGVIHTPIATINLQNYIDNTVIDMCKPNLNEQYLKALQKNLYKAKSILDIAKQNNNTLPQNYTVKVTGRTYMSGINLQQTSSIVREAALGKCYKYDLRTAMFAHMLQIIVNKKPDFNVKASYIHEYMTNKQEVRSRLAKCLVHTGIDKFTDPKQRIKFTIKLIKKMLAAIGFGSEVSDPRGAVKKHIGSIDDRAALLADPWMQGLLEEVEGYRYIMKQEYISSTFKKQIAPLLRKNGRSTLNKWCSFEYQVIESNIVNHVIQNIGSACVILQVHDALYLSKPIQLGDMNVFAHDIEPLANFEYEAIDSINYNKATIDRAKVAEVEQQKRIEVEEHKATNYVGSFVRMSDQELAWEKLSNGPLWQRHIKQKNNIEYSLYNSYLQTNTDLTYDEWISE